MKQSNKKLESQIKDPLELKIAFCSVIMILALFLSE